MVLRFDFKEVFSLDFLALVFSYVSTRLDERYILHIYHHSNIIKTSDGFPVINDPVFIHYTVTPYQQEL